MPALASVPDKVPIPRELAMLGELGPMCLHLPDEDGEDSYGEVPFKAGRILCSTHDGRELFVLWPQRDAGPLRRYHRRRLLAVTELYERFMQRQSDGLYNCEVPNPRAPRYAGDVAILHYYAEKGGDRRPVEYVHYFEEPGVAPAYPALYSLGRNQFWIPRGRFHVAEEGIDFHPAR